MADVTVTLGAKDTGLQNALKKTKTSVAALKPAIAAVAAAGAAAFAAVGAAAAGMGVAISKAAQKEGLETAFIPLLGGADQAKARIEELSRFAASTPFELPEIAKASKALETLTRGALSTGKGLTLVGDVAAATDVPFSEISATIGRLYDGLQSGRPVGKVMARLQELGAISGDTRAKLEELSKSGSSQEAWKVAEQALGRFSGSMQLQSGTWNGLLSTLSDNISMALAKFGDPILQRLKPALQSIIGIVESLSERAAEFGETLVNVASIFIAAMSDGSIWTIMGDSIRIALGEAANFLFRSLSGVITSAVRIFQRIPESLVTGIGVVTKADFWKGMLQALLGAAAAFGAELLGIIAKALELFSRIPGLGKTLEAPIAAVRSASESLGGVASKNLASGGDTLAPFLDIWRKDVEANLSTVRDGFNEGFEGAGDVFDLSGVKNNLDSTFARLGETVGKLDAEAKNTAPKLAAALPGTINEEQASPLAAAQATNQPLFASSLAKIGGGGGIAGAPALLDESRKHTLFLKRIAEGIGRLSPQPALS